MAKYMNRQNSLSTYDGSVGGGAGPYQYIELVYSAPGPGEWIFLPDALNPISVTVVQISGDISFSIEATDSPPNLVAGDLTTIARSTAAGGLGQAATYTLYDNLESDLHFSITGPTAIRLNLASGVVQLSIRS